MKARDSASYPTPAPSSQDSTSGPEVANKGRDFSQDYLAFADAKTNDSEAFIQENHKVRGANRNMTTSTADKVCVSCGGVMKRTSRQILSPATGVALIFLGLILMAFYGYATNFGQPPWYTKFALPAVYYIGSVFIAVGVLFFFIREKVWRCGRCSELLKR
jgi:hypothetical protein